MAPDLRKKVDANRAAREALENGMKKQQEAQVLSPICACKLDSSAHLLISTGSGPRLSETCVGRSVKVNIVPAWLPRRVISSTLPDISMLVL